MKILYISHKPIYPKADGGCVAMANFLDLLLNNNYNVKHLSIETNKHSFNLTSYPKEIALKIKPEAVKIDADIKISGALPYLLKDGSYNVQRFYSKTMEDKVVNTINSSEFDLIILESLFSTPYLKAIRNTFKGKVFLRSHNVEFKIWEDLKNNTSNPLKKVYLNKLFKDIRKYELETLCNVDGILTISNEDANFFKHLTATPIETVSLALNTENETLNDYSASNLFHLGGIDWKPNKEAVERLIKLFSNIKKYASTAQLRVIGKGTEKLDINNDDSIFLEGFINELESLCISSGILVTPIISGSGIRIKILEMMALGIPVITTKKGAQGIDYKNDNCLIVVDSDDDIVEACIQLISNKSQRKEIGTNAKSYISKYHSILNTSKKLNSFLETK